MSPLSGVDIGPSDAAAHDPHFPDKYVEPHMLERLLLPKYNVITGGKGSGKTALIKALHDIHRDAYARTVDVSFEEFSFAALMDGVLEIARTSGVSDLSVMINYWKYSLVTESMKQIVLSDSSADVALLKISAFLKNEGHLEEVVPQRMHGLADRQWRKFDKATQPRRPGSDYPGAVSAETIMEVKNYPWRAKPFSELVVDFEEYLERNDKRVLITLDGLDVLQVRGTSDREQIKLVFEGLIAATYQLSTSRLGSHLVVKALVPYDVYLDLNLRDQDKFAERCGKIEWDRDSLREFLRKRRKRSRPARLQRECLGLQLEQPGPAVWPLERAAGRAAEIVQFGCDIRFREVDVQRVADQYRLA